VTLVPLSAALGHWVTGGTGLGHCVTVSLGHCILRLHVHSYGFGPLSPAPLVCAVLRQVSSPAAEIGSHRRGQVEWGLSGPTTAAVTTTGPTPQGSSSTRAPSHPDYGRFFLQWYSDDTPGAW